MKKRSCLASRLINLQPGLRQQLTQVYGHKHRFERKNGAVEYGVDKKLD